MKVTFDLDLDGGSWPTPLDDSDAVAGVVSVGPRGLVDLLELHLGLPPPPSDIERAAALAAALREHDGYWSRSAAVDPLGVGERLLRLRDALGMHGWRGEHASPRLQQLADATADVGFGLADRLAAIESRLARRPLTWTVSVAGAPAEYAHSWRQLFSALNGAGAAVMFEPPSWDAMEPGSIAAKDIQFLRPEAIGEAAYEAAAWIGSDAAPTVIIGRSRILDGALAEIGLPTTGAPIEHADNLLLEVLPLCLSFAFRPLDLHGVLAFLRLPATPLPRRVADELARALSEWPAVGGPTWRAALEAAVAACPEGSRGEVQGVAHLLFGELATPNDLANELRRRVACVREWAKRNRPTVGDDSPWRAVAEQCRVFEAVLQHLDADRLDAAAVRALVVQVTKAVPRLSALAASRMTCVSEPGALLRPVDRVAWWSFSSSGISDPCFELTHAEREHLAGRGVQIPDRVGVACAAAQRWWRALRAASRSLLLVCPIRGESGERCDPHPVLDELLQHASEAQRRALNPRRRVDTSLREVSVPSRIPPAARRTWRIPDGRIGRRPLESPGSVASLLGCSFQWALRYWTPLRSRYSSMPDGPLLYGRLAHELLRRLFETGISDPALAAAEIARSFDTDGPGLAGPLFEAGADATRAFVRSAVVESARRLFQDLHSAGLRVVASEHALRDPLRTLGTDLEGRPDLVLGPKPFVLDFKWSLGGHRDALERGSAIQLAFYSYLAEHRSESTEEVDVGYLILRSQQFLTTATASNVPGAWIIAGPRPRAIFEAAKASYLRRVGEASAGMLVAVANCDGPNEDALASEQETPSEVEVREPGAGIVGGELVLDPPCRYCEYAILCGLAFGGSR